jgi:Kef-type K+ transport system membrane component KefB
VSQRVCSGTGNGPSSITAAVAGTIAAFFAFVVATAVVAAQAVNGAFAVVVAIVFAAVVAGASGNAVYWLSRLAVKHRSQEIFLSLFLAMIVFGCLISADVLSHLEIWLGVGPVLLYLGLLTVLKAPFD